MVTCYKVPPVVDGSKHSADLVVKNTLTVQITLATSKQQLGFLATYDSLSTGK